MHDPEPPLRLQTSFARPAEPQQMTVSPKRKRGSSDPAVPTTQPFAPRLNTSAFPGPVDARCASASEPHSGALLAAATVESGSESPRSRVASQFERLQLHKGSGGGGALPAIDFGSGDAGAIATKKAKHSAHFVDQQLHEGGNRSSNPHKPSTPSQPVLEIAETPQHQRVSFATTTTIDDGGMQSSPPPPSSSPSVKLFLSTRRPNPKLHRRSPSPSIRTYATSSSSSTSASSLPSAPPPPSDQAALTWQDSEITGHEIDREQDDDGYGINGLGFRPTHAVAQHRALKRRQQILEWRAREAREARQKRSERRRLAAIAPERKVGEAQKRMVRFA
ncbi:Synapse-associated protein of 47 kDa [Lasiodiplodia hormozganensis]|uniref:Synapse-associated protein of 47 kDa n=1 Tax=Lasiodiplodia hormozganensis TaxID=869390 RepID=A0AA39WBP2_9PEZI|nr:Synapse-associated protein of 47 kDa [Lasiodiplodia hormozganensis]